MISSVAQALYSAHKEKATGWIKLSVNGRDSQLFLDHGDVVGARIGFAHQTPVQALLETGRLDLGALDALWARGEAGELEPETLELHDTPPEQLNELQVLASVRTLSAQAREVMFEVGGVERMFEPVDGALAVRAAFEGVADPSVLESLLFRCLDPAGCGEWLVSPEEQNFLKQLTSFQHPSLSSVSTAGLLTLLEYDGKVEVRSEEELHQQQVEVQRAADAQARRDADARRALELARQAETERLATEAQAQAEAERVAESRAREAEAARTRELARHAEAVRAAEDAQAQQDAERLAQAVALEAAAARATAESLARREAERLEAAALEAEAARTREREAEDARLAAEAQAQQDAQNLAETAAREAEALRNAAEIRARQEAERLAAEAAREVEAVRMAAEMRAQQEADRLAAEAAREAEVLRATERIAVEEAQRQERIRLEWESQAAAARPREQGDPTEVQASGSPEPQYVDGLLEQPARGSGLLAAEPALTGSAGDAPLESLVEASWGELAAGPWEALAEEQAQAAPPVLPFPTEDEAEAMRHARAHAQDELIRDVNEALRRSASPDVDAWMESEATIELSPEEMAPIENPLAEILAEELANEPPSPHNLAAAASFSITEEPETDSFWTLGPPTHRAQPLVLGPPPGPPVLGQEDDLWRIVQHERAPDEKELSNSFEEALRRVDAHLEHLVGLNLVAPEASSLAAPVEGIIETTLDPAEPGPPLEEWFPGDNATLKDESEGRALEVELAEVWPFEEDDLASDPSDPAEASRLRRQRLLRRAMENLGAFQRPPAASVEPTATATSAPGLVSAPAGATADDKQLAAVIAMRYAELKTGKDHFAILGLSRTAGRDQVKTAFLNLAKVFHPDRLPQTLVELAPKMTAVFESIREAYDVLLDDGRREAYVATLERARVKTALSPPRNELMAEDHFKRGELSFKKREYLEAERHYEKAGSIDPKPVFLAARAWAIYMDPARRAEVAAARQMMLDAIRADANCDRAHYQLGVIARVEGDFDRAEKHFRDAVRSNPKHLEANQELRLIDMRRKNNPGKRGGAR